ncbi:unnamed protein product [Paramecium primaurelia]|uniref:Transmembrane protein n=1 Tax=Paramecium primaurelia TaxID=5886 RepID=A0A8S1MEB1_PARPR|nr:unnamed protein product [Paramecium primaurelia]
MKKEFEKQKKKYIGLTEIFNKMIQITLQSQKSITLNSTVQLILLFICKFQLTFFLFYVNYEWQDAKNLYMFNKVLLLIFRIDIFLQTFEVINRFVIYLILSILIIEKLFCGFLLWDGINKTKYIYLNKILGIYIQLYYGQFHILFTTLTCLFLTHQYNQLQVNNINYIHLLFGILCFLLLQLEAIYHLLISEQSIDGKIICFDRLRITVKEYIIQFLNLIIIILFSVVKNSEIVLWIIHLLVLLSTSINIINIQENQTIIENNKKFIIYFSDSFTIVYIFYSLIQQIVQRQDFQVLIYTFFSFPLLLKIILKFDNLINTKLDHLAFSKSKVDIFAITQFLIKKQNNQFQPVLFKLYIHNYHLKKCKNVKCICNQQIMYLDPRDAATLTQDIDKDFVHQKLKQIRKYLFTQNIANIDEIQHYTIMYGILLANNGWPIQSIKHFNQLVYGKSSSKSSVISVNQSLQNPHSFSATIRKDSSSQTQTDPEKQLDNIKKSNKAKSYQYSIPYQVNFDQIQLSKIFYIQNEIKENLRYLFGNSTLTAEMHNLSEQIQIFMQQEMMLDKYVNEIKKILKMKLKYFENLMILIKEKRMSDLMKQLMNITNKMILFKNSLQSQYEIIQSKRLQSLQIFYEAEVFKNYLDAFKMHNQSTLSQEQIQIINKNLNINFNSNDMSYIILQIDDDLQNAEILKYSSNILQIIDYNSNEELTFEQLLLPFILREHPLLISRFFKIGQSKYYKQFNQTFIRTQNNIAKSIAFTFDNIVQHKQDKIILVGLLQEIIIQQPFIMIDVNQVVGGITNAFFSLLGYNQQFIDTICDFSIFYQLKISQIFPSFNDITQNEDQQQPIMKFNNVDTYFIDLEILINEFTIENSNTLKQQSVILNKLWGRQNCTKFYLTNITIQSYHLYGFYYYIIHLDSSFQKTEGVNSSKTQDRYSEDRKKSELSQNFQISHLDMSLEEAQPGTINQISIQSREGYSEKSQTKNKNINLFQVQEVLQEDVEQKVDQYLQVLSPNKSTSQLIDNQRDKFIQQTIQQDYYTVNTSQKLNKLNRSNDHKEQNIKGDQIIGQLFRDSLKNTEYGVGNSEVIKKYELLSRLTKEKTPQILKLAISTIVIFILIQTISLSLVVSILNNDILQFISDVEIIALHASIQGPHDLFFSMRNTISAYQQMGREGYIPNSIVPNLTAPYEKNLGLGYFELRDSFYKQLDNEYLRGFLDGESMELFFMKNNDTQNYAIEIKTFRECLFIILQYQYAQMRVLQNKLSASGQPFQVFLFSNYYNIQDKLENITNDILQYSKTRSVEVGEKWSSISICFSILILVIAFTIVFQLHQYYKLYDRFLQLLNFMDKQKVQFEIEKLNQLLKVIISNQECVYSYQFDLQHQESLMQNYVSLNKISNTKKNLENNSLIQIPRRYFFIIWTIIACVFQVYIIVTQIKTNEYISKYDDTADFYFMIQNLKFRSGSMYMYREHLFRFKNFTYLTTYDLQRAYQLIDKAQNNIQQYLDFTNSFQENKYLLSDEFISFFQYQQNNNLCEFIDQIYLNFMSLYCEKSFDGLLKQGSISVLNFMSNQIKNQQAINNFTKRVDVDLYELEGSQIVMRSFFRISDEFQIGLKQITTAQNQFTLIITIIFITYLTIFLYVILFIVKKLLIKEYALLRRIVYLIPQQIVLGDESFERFLKQLALTQELK